MGTTTITTGPTLRVCQRCQRIIKAGDIHGASYCTVRGIDGHLYQHRCRPEGWVRCGDDQRPLDRLNF